MIEDRVLEQIVAAGIAKLPAKLREGQTDILRASLNKAQSLMADTNCKPEWIERVLRKLAEQFWPWKGNE